MVTIVQPFIYATCQKQQGFIWSFLFRSGLFAPCVRLFCCLLYSVLSALFVIFFCLFWAPLAYSSVRSTPNTPCAPYRIKDADAMKPSGCQDLGWRPLPPEQEEKPPPIVYKVPPPPRPRSGHGVPFGPVGGRWRAPEGWEGAHTGWQVSTDSEHGIGERWPPVGSGSKVCFCLGLPGPLQFATACRLWPCIVSCNERHCPRPVSFFASFLFPPGSNTSPPHVNGIGTGPSGPA